MSKCGCTYLKVVGPGRMEVVHSVSCEHGPFRITDSRIGFAHLGMEEIKANMDGLEQITRDLTEENRKLRSMIDNGLGWEDIKDGLG